jgi:hypothetical protein
MNAEVIRYRNILIIIMTLAVLQHIPKKFNIFPNEHSDTVWERQNKRE